VGKRHLGDGVLEGAELVVERLLQPLALSAATAGAWVISLRA